MKHDNSPAVQVANWPDFLTILAVFYFIMSYLDYFFQGFVLLALVEGFVRFRQGRPASLGLCRPGAHDLLKGLGLGIVLLGLALGTAWVLRRLPWPVPQQSAELLIKSDRHWSRFLPLLLGVAAITPFSEELFFRAYSLPLFRETWGKGKGNAIAAIFFAAMHLDIWRFLPLCLAGWLLNRLYLRAGSLWPAVLAHCIWNAGYALTLFFSG